MRTFAKNRLARYLKFLLDILFWLSIFSFIGLLVWTAASPFVLQRSQSFGTVTVPVRIGTGTEPRLELSFDGRSDMYFVEAYLEEAGGTLVITTNEALPIVITNAAKLVLLAGLSYVIYLLRGLLNAIKAGEPFALQNAVRIRRVGYMAILLGLLGPAVQFGSAAWILQRLPRAVPAIQAGPTFEGATLLVALTLLMLAQIWSYGIELEHERQLTI